MARIEILNPLRRSAGSGSRPESYSSGRGLHYAQNGGMHVAHHKHHRRHHGRRNPLGFGGDEVKLAGFGIAGGVGALALPALLLPSQNSGIMGYALNLGTSVALKFAGNMLSKQAGDGAFIGGLVATGLRIVKDNLPSIPMGAYWESYFAVPPVSNSFGQVLKSPYPMPALPAPAKGMAGGRFAARF